MSILIKGVEMPKGDSGLVLVIFKDGTVYSPGPLTKGLIREKNVEAVPVPTPHGRLIDADAEAKKWGLDKAVKYGNKDAEQQHFSYSTMMMYEIRDILDDAETVIESEE